MKGFLNVPYSGADLTKISVLLIIVGLVSFNKTKVDSGTSITVVEIQENNEIQFGK